MSYGPTGFAYTNLPQSGKTVNS